MCPDIPQLVKCPNCLTTLWIEDQALVTCSHDSDNIQAYISPDIQDYKELLSGGCFTREREYYLRTRLWWAFNDIRRYGDDPQLAYSDFEIENLQNLDQLIVVKTDHDRLVKAEIKRELECFSEAVRLLEPSFSGQFETRVTLLNELIRKEYPFVVRWPENNQHPVPRYEGIDSGSQPELYRLLKHIEKENDGITQLSELNCQRILNDKELMELIIESYHNLKGWTNNRTDSAAEKLQTRILTQFEQACSWLPLSQPANDVNLGWLIQEYICYESEDYSFGVFLQEQVSSDSIVSVEGGTEDDNFIETLRKLIDTQERDK